MVKFNLNVFYFFSLFFMCFFQIIVVFLKLNPNYISYFIYFNLILSLLVVVKYSKILNSWFFIKNISLIFLMIFICFYYNLFFVDSYDYLGRGGVSTINTYTIGMVVWFCLGIGLAFSFKNISRNNFFINIIPLLLIFIFMLNTKGIEQINYIDLSSNSFRVDHLVLGAFIIYLICLTHSQSLGISLVYIFILNSIILIMIGGRSDFFVYIASSIIFNVLFKKFDIYSGIKLVFLLIFIWFLGVNFSSFDRFYNLSSEDESLVARQEILNSNIMDLPQKILISNPNYLIEKHFNFGAYTHNILSAWEIYGFLFFIFLVCLLISNMIFLFKNKDKLMDSSSGKFILFLFIFTFLSLVFSKVIFYYPFWLCLGFLSVYRLLYTRQIKGIIN